jgi:3-isopropylmalate/(R)-2-methylmalate dehydratase small subunit
MRPLRRINAPLVVLPQDNIDTDQIIPARFLTTTTREGLGRHCFHDWRHDAKGRERADFPLRPAVARGAGILLAGRNFGCGSSREHAPWALLDLGIRVIISTRIADIFRNNALKNGLLAIEVSETDAARIGAHAGHEILVDLEERAIELPDGARIAFDIEPFARQCLLRGIDALGYLLEAEAEIAAYEQGLAEAQS